MIEKGHYQTIGGYRAIVSKLKSIGGQWTFFGAIECPSTYALVMTRWFANGENQYDQKFSIVGDQRTDQINPRMAAE